MIPSESFLHHLAHQALQSIFRALWEAYREIQVYQCCPSEVHLPRDGVYPLEHLRSSRGSFVF